MTEEGIDRLFLVRNHLHIGNYQVCVNDAQAAELTMAEETAERDFLMYRALVALGKYSTVKGEIKASSSSDLQAVKRLAVYLHKKADRAEVVEEIKKLMEDGISMDNPNTALLSATVLLNEANYDDALRCLHGKDHLECIALTLQILLILNRVDVAKKELRKMQAVDDDATLTQLSQAWVGLALGGEKTKDSFYIFQELADKYGHTAALLNGQAAARMQMNEFEDAEGNVQSAQERGGGDIETLINTVASAQYQSKTKEALRALNETKDSFPSHPWTAAVVDKEAEFDRIAASF